MPTTITEAFNKLKSNLEITEPQVDTISTRQQNIRSVLDHRLNILDSFLSGSYSRKTLISPFASCDIDIFFILNSSYFSMKPADLLDLVRDTLKVTYPKTPDISRNGQAVTIQFTDFNVDVVPTFNRKGGGYLIPNSITNTWLPTDPKRHVEIFAEANRSHNGMLIPLIKMLKGWNKNHGEFFQSFHLEVLALEILNPVRIDDFPSGVRYFFDHARTIVTGQNMDPAGYDRDVGSYIDTQEKFKTAITKLQTAYEHAIRAESAPTIHEAYRYWDYIFGFYFPSYD